MRWELKERAGVSGEEFFEIPSSRTHSDDWLDVTFDLEPGESYRVYVTAMNTDETNVTLESTQKMVEVGIIPLGKINTASQAMVPILFLV